MAPPNNERAAAMSSSAPSRQESVCLRTSIPVPTPSYMPRSLREIKESSRPTAVRDGAALRLDTAGLANLVHGRDVTPELSNWIDSISISLSADNARDYAAVCPSRYGEEAFNTLPDLIHIAGKRFKRTMVATVHPNAYRRLGVECPVDLEERRRAADSLAAPLRIRSG